MAGCLPKAPSTSMQDSLTMWICCTLSESFSKGSAEHTRPVRWRISGFILEVFSSVSATSSLLSSSARTISLARDLRWTKESSARTGVFQ